MKRALVIVAALAMWAVPQPSYAFLGWLFGHHRDPCTGEVVYRPLFPRLGLFRRAWFAPQVACDPCGSVQYVQQTSYRAEVVRVPVTTYQPVVTTDPCTGCPVTTMRPVITYVQQVRYRPVITYRPVCCPTMVSTPVCCPPTSTSDCCTPSLPSTTEQQAPSLPSTQPAPSQTPPTYRPSQPQQQESYRQPMDQPKQNQPKLQPIPDKSSGASHTPRPKLVFPDQRTASVPGVQPAVHTGTNRVQVQKASQVQPARGFRWRPARPRVAQR